MSLLAGAAARIAHAGIVLVSQDRFVDVVSDDGRHSNQAATDFGPFLGNVNLNGVGAFQQSTLSVAPDGTGAVFTALLDNGAGLAVSKSSFLVNFDVTGAAVPFVVTYSSLTASEAGPMPGATGSLSGFSAPGTLVNGDVRSGKLETGRYSFQADDNFRGEIRMDLRLGTAVVPLPPGLWQALSTLPVLVLGMWLWRAKRSMH